MKLLLPIIAMLFFASLAEAQETDLLNTTQEPKMLKAVNRAMIVMDIALHFGESEEESEFELTGQQKEELQKLSANFDEIMSDPSHVNLIDSVPADDNEDVVQFISNLTSLENNLIDGVLLPHQSPIALGMVFSASVANCKGDTKQAIEHYYFDRIKIDSKREEKLNSISTATKREIAEAAREFKAKLKQIQKKAEAATRGLLTDGEKRLLGEPQE